MMIHHDDYYRPFPSIELVAVGSGDGDGPSASRLISNYDIYHVFGGGGGGGSSVASGAAAVGGSVVGTRTLQQPFAISPIESTVTAFRSPGAGAGGGTGGGGMAASWECPFTNAQWKELERQAMIYKYMVAAVPVPPHLLIPIPMSVPSDSAASFPPLGNNAGLSLKFTNEADQEPGRCRRTDGKKWRCSRDVAPPNHKYCERHMHRSRPRPRPRSRKPVELHAIAKKTRSNPTISAAERPFTAAAISSPTVNNNNNNNGAGSQFVSQPYLQNLAFLDKSNDQAANLNANQPFASAYKDPRGLNWTVAETGQQWHHHAVPTQIDMPGKSCLINEPTVVNQHYGEEEALNLNSVGDMGAAEDQRKAQYPMFLEEAPPRGFIDAWSIGESDEQNASSRDTISSYVSSKGKFSIPSLDLSMGSNNSMDSEMDHIPMGLGLIESNPSHKCGTLGGPLGEVLQPRTATTTSNNQSYSSGSSPPAAAVSSPSGVLQKNLASFSDSSENSSPTTTRLAAVGSIARPEICFDVVGMNQSINLQSF